MRDAGSEKTKTDVATTHGQMIESNNINRSLLVLGISHLISSDFISTDLISHEPTEWQYVRCEPALINHCLIGRSHGE